MGPISKRDLSGLKKYKYAGVDKSLLSNHVLSPYIWKPLAALVPAWIAPNVVTLSGLMLVVLNMFTLVYHNPHFDRIALPPWVYHSWALGLFGMQTLDAIDGSHARKTGMSGPLGEWFDHSCDAITTILGVLLSCAALDLGRSWWTVASMAASSAAFYLSTWEEYHTGTLYLGYISGPVEGIVLLVLTFILTGVYGPQIWHARVLTTLGIRHVFPKSILGWDLDFRLNEATIVFAVLALAYNVIASYRNVIIPRKRQQVSYVWPILRLLPFLLHALSMLTWLSAKERILFEGHVFIPFILVWGLGFANQVGYIITAHVTKASFPAWNTVSLVAFLCALDANMPNLLGRSSLIQTTPSRVGWTVLINLCICIILHARFAFLLINQICTYLGIACFTVRKRDAKGNWVDAKQVQAR